LKLFVRVKERIIPDQCRHAVTTTFIEITLMKDNQNSLKWNRLEPNEYSLAPLLIHLPTPSLLPRSTNFGSTTNKNVIIDTSNKGEFIEKFIHYCI
jgi:hypothetical protein